MSNKNFWIGLGLLLLPCASVSAAELDLGLNAGFRNDTIKMNFERVGFDGSDTYATKEKIKFHHLRTLFLQGCGQLRLDPLVVQANVQYGWVLKNHKEQANIGSTINGIYPTFEERNAKQKKGGNIFDVDLSIGYLYDLSNRFALLPKVGFAYDHLKLKNKESNQNHKAHRYSPFIGLDLLFNLNQTCKLVIGSEYHFATRYKESFAMNTFDYANSDEMYNSYKIISKKSNNFAIKNKVKILHQYDENLTFDLAVQHDYSRIKFSKLDGLRGDSPATQMSILNKSGKRKQNTFSISLGATHLF